MATIIEMPKLSDTMEEGGVASWLKKEGQSVEEGEALLEIETDKATMEYASPEEGILLKILVQPGTTVALNEPIAIIGINGEAYDLASLLANRKGRGKPSAPASHGEGSKSGGVHTTPTTLAPAASSAPAASGRVKASPLAKKVAAAKGVDLARVSGSGPNGRVILKDLGDVTAAAPSSANSARATMTQARRGEDQVIPLSQMRKTIAKRLLAGKNEAPHFYLTASCNMEQVLHWRQDLNTSKSVQENLEAKVSVNDIIIMAASHALRSHPTVNSSWQGDSILQHGGINIAMAVALPTGLVTPVIRDTDHLGIREIARTAKAFGEKARTGRLTNDDFAGGTFTISNLGMTCVEEFTAIINPPQAAILACGRTVPTPWVSERGELIVQNRMKVTLSCDHRVVDGMVGAKFLETLVSYLEAPLRMFS